MKINSIESAITILRDPGSYPLEAVRHALAAMVSFVTARDREVDASAGIPVVDAV